MFLARGLAWFLLLHKCLETKHLFRCARTIGRFGARAVVLAQEPSSEALRRKCGREKCTVVKILYPPSVVGVVACSLGASLPTELLPQERGSEVWLCNAGEGCILHRRLRGGHPARPSRGALVLYYFTTYALVAGACFDEFRCACGAPCRNVEIVMYHVGFQDERSQYGTRRDVPWSFFSAERKGWRGWIFVAARHELLTCRLSAFPV